MTELWTIQKERWRYVMKADGHVYAPRPLKMEKMDKTEKTLRRQASQEQHTVDIGLYYETDLEIYAEELIM